MFQTCLISWDQSFGNVCIKNVIKFWSLNVNFKISHFFDLKNCSRTKEIVGKSSQVYSYLGHSLFFSEERGGVRSTLLTTECDRQDASPTPAMWKICCASCVQFFAEGSGAKGSPEPRTKESASHHSPDHLRKETFEIKMRIR